MLENCDTWHDRKTNNFYKEKINHYPKNNEAETHKINCI